MSWFAICGGQCVSWFAICCLAMRVMVCNMLFGNGCHGLQYVVGNACHGLQYVICGWHRGWPQNPTRVRIFKMLFGNTCHDLQYVVGTEAGPNIHTPVGEEGYEKTTHI